MKLKLSPKVSRQESALVTELSAAEPLCPKPTAEVRRKQGESLLRPNQSMRAKTPHASTQEHNVEQRRDAR